MTPTMTMAVMLAVTLGAALYVAWPLLFGRVRAEEYLPLGDEEALLEHAGARTPTPARRAIREDAIEPVASRKRRKGADSRVDLDVEQEIEAFRRRSRHVGDQSSSLTCPSCGSPIKDPEAAFCSKCGTSVRGAAGQNRKNSGRSREDR